MTARRPRRRKTQTEKRGTRGPRGARGAPGKQGPPGTPAPSADAIARLAEDLANTRHDLQVQFKRIAQLQAELDDLRANIRDGQTPPL